MKSLPKPQPKAEEVEQKVKRAAYETPAIVYEGFITTRAGSPINRGGADPSADPADLFGDD